MGRVAPRDTDVAMSRTRIRRGSRSPQVGIWLACAAVIVVGVVANQSAVHWRATMSDDHLYSYHGWCVLDGARPYLDLWNNKPPGTWWLNAGAIALCGTGSASEVLIGSLALLVTMGALVGIARLAYRRSLALPAALIAAVLLTDIRFECGANRTETYLIACECVAVLAYLRWLRGARARWLVLCGLAAGTAPLFKQAGLAAVGAGALHLAWTQWRARAAGRGHPCGWRPWVVVALTLPITPLVAAAVLGAQGALGEAIFAMVGFNRAYFAVDDATWTNLGHAVRVYLPSLRPLAGISAVVLIGLAWGLARGLADRRLGAGHWPPRRGVGLLVIWLVLAFYLVLVSPGRQGYHLMVMLPSLGLLALYPLHLLAGRRGLPRQLVAVPLAVATLVAWAYVLGAGLPGNVTEMQRCWRSKPTWYALGHTQPTHAELQGAELARLAGPHETVYAWGWNTGAYRYSERRPASRFATFEKTGQVGRHADFIFEQGTADIRRRRPAAITIARNDYFELRRSPQGEFAAWLCEEYEIVTTIGGTHVLARRDRQ